MKRVLDMIRVAAKWKETVLLLGERGTGKDLVARAIHETAGRKLTSWVVVCCGALTESLVESELFGHTSGAFTGARGPRRGLAQLSEGGTLFLDEIGVLPLHLQARFLRLVEEHRFRPVGGEEVIELSAQVVAATNRNLRGAARQGGFLPDLVDRLTVFPIQIPPVRDRREDIPLLIRHFFGQEKRYDLWRGLEGKPLDFLASRHWPGNVRQIRNLAKRLVMLGGSTTTSLDEVRRQYELGEIWGCEGSLES